MTTNNSTNVNALRLSLFRVNMKSSPIECRRTCATACLASSDRRNQLPSTACSKQWHTGAHGEPKGGQTNGEKFTRKRAGRGSARPRRRRRPHAPAGECNLLDQRGRCHRRDGRRQRRLLGQELAGGTIAVLGGMPAGSARAGLAVLVPAVRTAGLVIVRQPCARSARRNSRHRGRRDCAPAQPWPGPARSRLPPLRKVCGFSSTWAYAVQSGHPN